MQHSINRSLCALVVAGCLYGCQTPQPKPATTPRDQQWVAALVTRPDGDTDRQCVRDALQMSFALAAFRDGEYNDQLIESTMLDRLPNEGMRKIRKADIAEWRRTHEPSSVATLHLDLCMTDNGNALVPTDRWLRCFLSVEPATLISIYRRTGRSMVMAVQAVTPYYPISVNPSEIAELGRQIYDLKTEADDMQFRENMFSDCLLLEER